MVSNAGRMKHEFVASLVLVLCRHPLLPRHSHDDLCQTPAAQSSPNSDGDFQRAASGRNGRSDLDGQVGTVREGPNAVAAAALVWTTTSSRRTALIRSKFTPNCATEVRPSRHDMRLAATVGEDCGYRRQRARRQTYIRFCAKGCAKGVRESARSIDVTTRSDNQILWSANGSTAKWYTRSICSPASLTRFRASRSDIERGSRPHALRCGIHLLAEPKRRRRLLSFLWLLNTKIPSVLRCLAKVPSASLRSCHSAFGKKRNAVIRSNSLSPSSSPLVMSASMISARIPVRRATSNMEGDTSTPTAELQ